MAEAYLTRRSSRVKRGEVKASSYTSLTIPDLVAMKSAVISHVPFGGGSGDIHSQTSLRNILEIIIEDGKVVQMMHVSGQQSGADTSSYVYIDFSSSSDVVTFDASTGTITIASQVDARFYRTTPYKYIAY